MRCIQEGPRFLKETTFAWRKSALTSTRLHDREAKKRFLASTLSRAVDWPVTDEQQTHAVEECKKRWFKEREFDPRLLKELDRYLEQLPFKTAGVTDIDVLPGANATINSPRNKGGAAAALYDNRINYLTEWAFKNVFERDTFDSSNSYAKAAGAEFTPQDVAKVFDSYDLLEDLDENPRLPTYEETREQYLDGPSVLPLKPHPLAEMGGKVRVVTLHPAEEVQVARNITARWLAGLRRCITTRDMLIGRQVVLEAQRENGSKLFSADLSAATDYIPHGLAVHTATKLCELLKRPEDVPLVTRLFGPKMVGPEKTCNGIHMGLGPSWTVLSLLNGFAAWYAGARKETYQICGDDLIGFWPKKLADKYTDTLERLGLVVNLTKSFYGKSGVFCERMMRVKGRFAVSQDLGHIGAMTASKLLSGRSTNRYATLDSLEYSSVLDMREEVRQALLPRGTGPGMVRNGGNGRGGLHIRGLIGLVKDQHRKRVAKPLPKSISEVFRLEGAMDGEVSIQDFTIAYNTALRLERARSGQKPEKPYVPTAKDFRRLSQLNRKSQKTLTQLAAEVRLHSKLSSKNKRHALHMISRARRKDVRNSEFRKRLERILGRPRANRYLSLKTCQRLLKGVTHPEMVDRLLVHAKSLVQRDWNTHRRARLAALLRETGTN
jgi:hypothetical protein